MSTKSATTAILLAVFALTVTVGKSSAAEGSINLQNGVLTIEGDDYNDYCEVFVDGDEIEVELTVRDAQGNIDDFDDKDYDLDDVSKIVFKGFDGDDTFWNSTSVPSVAYGGNGNDVFVGGYSNDDLHGDAGDDYLAGRSGDDDLFGGSGKDYLYGGTDDDYLKAGSGEDEWVIAGQSGEDTFAMPATLNFMTRRFVALNVNVYYEDFNPNEDREVLFWVATSFYLAQPIF